MTGFAFDRVYHLQVINKGVTTATELTFNVNTIIDDLLSGGEQTSPLLSVTKSKTELSLAEVTFNRVSAKIKFSGASSSASSDTHEISIYNLDRETISAIRTTGAKIVLRAGYQQQYPNDTPDKFPVVFKGEVVTSKVTRNGNDTITELTLSSAVTERKRSKISQKFSSNTSLGTVLRTIANEVGVPYVVDIGSKETLVLRKQKSWSGATLEVLDRIAKEYGLRVYFYNEVLQIVDLLANIQATSNNPAIVIDKERIKGSLSLSTDHTKTEVDDEKVEVEFTMFLEPRIIVGSIVRVEVEGSINDFKVEAVIHRLDTHGAVWDTVVTATGVKSKSIQVS